MITCLALPTAGGYSHPSPNTHNYAVSNEAQEDTTMAGIHTQQAFLPLSQHVVADLPG